MGYFYNDYTLLLQVVDIFEVAIGKIERISFFLRDFFLWLWNRLSDSFVIIRFSAAMQPIFADQKLKLSFSNYLQYWNRKLKICFGLLQPSLEVKVSEFGSHHRHESINILMKLNSVGSLSSLETNGESGVSCALILHAFRGYPDIEAGASELGDLICLEDELRVIHILEGAKRYFVF